jgi:hypothetical protein
MHDEKGNFPVYLLLKVWRGKIMLQERETSHKIFVPALSPQNSQLEVPCYYGDYIIQGVGRLRERERERKTKTDEDISRR